MLTKKLTISIIFTCLIIFGISPCICIGQEVYTLLNQDTLDNNDTVPFTPIEPKRSRLEANVSYQAEDSIRMDIRSSRAYLYGNYTNAQLNYQDIELQSGYIELDFRKSLLFARGFLDSIDKKVNEPVFIDSDQKFLAKEMFYNIETKKGFIRRVVTSEGDGYLLGDSIKKMPNDDINISSGSYTTCDHHDHPHFDIHFKRAKVIPGDKIITGPAFLRIEGIPTPLVIPFGFFPNQKGQASGVLIPSYGESANRGFFLENGGYYFGINDYIDLALRGDIYSRGSWALKTESVYKVRYRYRGRLNINYSVNKFGDRDSPDFERKRNFFIRWNHSQEPGAHPNRRFSANVNAGSSDYNTYNPTSTSDYLSNTFSSSINFSTQIAGLFNLSAAMSHSQNTLTQEIQMRLPELSISTVSRIYPFRWREISGKPKWYENINLNYTMLSQNALITTDSLFSETRFRDFNNGIQHTIPVRSDINIGGWLNINNSFEYVERWYMRHYNKEWNSGILITPDDTIVGYLQTDTIFGFKAARNFRFSSKFGTRFYGFYDFTKGPVSTLRHVMTPEVNISFRPDFASPRWGYYRHYLTPGTQGPVLNRYSIFEKLVYGSPPAGRSGSIGFNITNNFEMKLRPKDDTLTSKKVILIESATISTSYDFARDSLNWSPLTIRGYTTLFRNLRINFSGSWDPYQVDSLGRRINRFEYKKSGKLFRRTNTELGLSLSYRLSSRDIESRNTETTAGTESEINEIRQHPEAFLDWDNPWSFWFSYSYTYSSILTAIEGERKKEMIQALTLNGDFNLTPKWKIELETGYDFSNKKLSFTRFRIWRDLHCWDLSLDWIPFGFRQSYMMTIRVKSSVLQDLKLTRKSDWRDYL